MAGLPGAAGIAALNASYAGGTYDAVQALEALRASVAADGDRINAFTHVDFEDARVQAEVSAKRWRRGEPLSVLDGIPVSIKDLIPMRGWQSRRGSLSTSADLPAAFDAPLVERLRGAGAVLFAKTTTTEFGWCIENCNPHAGITRNPLDATRTTGGSSCGAAAQIAAGWGPLAIGSDAGGSIRIPASYCGVVGFKPTFGAIPVAPQSAFAELAHFGPMTRDVGDCILAMGVLGGPDRRDPASLYPRTNADPVSDLRIGGISHIDTMGLQPEVAEAFATLIDGLGQVGVRTIEQPSLPIDPEAMWITWLSRIHESFLEWDDRKRSMLSPALQAAWEEGARLSAIELANARSHLRTLATRMAEQFADVDLLLTPATPSSAPTIEVEGVGRAPNWFSSQPYAYQFNVTQQPALSMPLARDSDGMPFNLQIVGGRYGDDRVLGFGKVVERHLRTGGAG